MGSFSGLCISGIGMITSVGRDAVTSCASIRAGITRPTEFADYKYLVTEEQDMEPIIGHAIVGVTEGFHFTGLWSRLAKLCLHDMAKSACFPDATDNKFWQRTAIIAAAPHINNDRFLRRVSDDSSVLFDAYFENLIAHFKWPIEVSQRYFSTKGSPGVFEAINQGDALIHTGDVDRVIILSVDSYLSQSSLEWLATYERIKTPNNPVGLSPGEAAACFVLEGRPTLNERQQKPLAEVIAAEVAEETTSFVIDKQASSENLRRILKSVVSASGVEEMNATLINDLNGEPWRATQYANARVGVNEVGPPLPTIMPAVSLGDVGAAVGAISICLATQVFSRNYNSYQHALITCSSEFGGVAAAALRRTN